MHNKIVSYRWTTQTTANIFFNFSQGSLDKNYDSALNNTARSQNIETLKL